MSTIQARYVDIYHTQLELVKQKRQARVLFAVVQTMLRNASSKLSARRGIARTMPDRKLYRAI